MPDELEVGDRAPGFDLPAVYGYKAGETSPSAEEKVMIKLKDFLDKKWVVLCFYAQDSSPEDTRLMIGFNEWNRKFKKRDVEVLGCSWNGVNSHQQFIEIYQLGFTLLADEYKKATEAYGVIKEIDDLGKMTKIIDRTTFVIDKTGMIRGVWRNLEDLRNHPSEIWEFIQKEKKST
jgi:thioredoxin-dependent peroxiredoxin